MMEQGEDNTDANTAATTMPTGGAAPPPPPPSDNNNNNNTTVDDNEATTNNGGRQSRVAESRAARLARKTKALAEEAAAARHHRATADLSEHSNNNEPSNHDSHFTPVTTATIKTSCSPSPPKTKKNGLHHAICNLPMPLGCGEQRALVRIDDNESTITTPAAAEATTTPAAAAPIVPPETRDAAAAERDHNNINNNNNNNNNNIMLVDDEEENERIRNRIRAVARTLESAQQVSVCSALSGPPSTFSLREETKENTIAENASSETKENVIASSSSDEEEENEEPTELPRIEDGNNEQRPGAFVARGRAYGDVPIWGRMRSNRNNNNATSTTPRGSATPRGRQSSMLRGWSSRLFFGERTSMIRAEPVDAETVVYANVTDQKLIRRIYYCVGVLVFILVAGLVVGLSVPLSMEREKGHGDGNPAGRSTSTDSGCIIGTNPDVFTLCRCQGTAEALVLSTEETMAYDRLKQQFKGNLLRNNFTISSCDPENQSLLSIANFERFGLTYDDNFLRATMLDHRQLYALWYMFADMNGNNDWLDSDNWSSTPDICNWYGVSCNAVFGVTGLYLGSNGLAGTIPHVIQFLPFLHDLDLSGNAISGSIPPELFNLHLRILDLSRNQITGEIPTEAGNLRHLVHVDLSHNAIEGPVPWDAFSSMQQLRSLHLDDNKMTGNISGSIGDLKSLALLGLSENQFEGPIPLRIANLTNLEQIDLGGNMFTGTLPLSLFTLPRLIEMFVHDNMFTGTIPESFCNRSQPEPLLLSVDCRGEFSIDGCSCCDAGICAEETSAAWFAPP